MPSFLRTSISGYLFVICILVYWFTAKCLSPNSKSIIHLFPCEDLLCRAQLAYLWVTVQTFHRRSFKNLCLLLQMETSQKSQKKKFQLSPTLHFSLPVALLYCYVWKRKISWLWCFYFFHELFIFQNSEINVRINQKIK